MFDLLKAALRQRPNELLIGEIRGEEGLIAFEAMQTGHTVMATFHASTVEKLIQRVTGSPINVPKTYVENLNVVVIQTAVELPNGKLGRRAVSISEIIGCDAANDAFSFVEVFRWDPVHDKFEFSRQHEQLSVGGTYRSDERHSRQQETSDLRDAQAASTHPGKALTDG